MLAIKQMILVILIFAFDVNTSFNCSKRDPATEITTLEIDINASDEKSTVVVL